MNARHLLCGAIFAVSGLSITSAFAAQKTAYEIVVGDWSSDVCSSDLVRGLPILPCWNLIGRCSSVSVLYSWCWPDRKSVV